MSKRGIAEIINGFFDGGLPIRLSAYDGSVAGEPLPPEWVMATLTEAMPKDAILVEEGLTSTATLPAYFPYRDRNSFFGNVSGGASGG